MVIPNIITDYEWGNDCGLNDQLCQQYDCALCKWSWPSGENNDHSDAACRCRKMNSFWTKGDECSSLTEQFCSGVSCSSNCRYTWPVTGTYNDGNMGCRCDDIADFTTTYPKEIVTKDAKGDFPPLEIHVNDVALTLYVHYPEWTSDITANKDSL